MHSIAISAYSLALVPTGTLLLATGLYFEACALHFRTIFEDMRSIFTEHRATGMRAEVQTEEFKKAKVLKEVSPRAKVQKQLIEAVNFHITTKR